MKIQAVCIEGRRWVRTVTQKETNCLLCKNKIPSGECFRADTNERMNKRGFRCCETCANRHWRYWKQKLDKEYKEQNPVQYVDCPFCGEKFRGKRYWAQFSESGCRCGARVECTSSLRGILTGCIFTPPIPLLKLKS